MAYSIGFDIFAKDRASNTFDHVGDSADRTGGRFKKYGAMATAGAAVAGLAILKVGADTASSASDQNEALNKSGVIFGKNAAAIDKWSDGAWKSLGLSKTAALEAASGFGDMFSQLGFSRNKATDMSKAVVQMSADLGSFNNLPTAEVSDMMSAAFRGEYDSLQRLIPNINASRVETEALAMTGKKSAKELTAQEKAAATLAIVQKDGARATGDFAKTSGGLANQQKILRAAFENTKAKVGQALLPILTKLGGWFIRDGLPAIQRFGGWISGHLWPALQRGYQTIMPGLKQALAIVSGGVGQGTVSWKKIGEVVTQKVIPFLSKLASVYLPVLATNLRTGIEVVKALWRAFETWRSIMGKVFSFILGGFSTVTRIWAGVLSALGHIPGFGWAKEAARKMRGAADAADRIRNRINAIPSSKKVSIVVSARTQTGRIKVGNEYVNVGAFAKGGRNIPPGWKWVGEDGPELMWTPGGDHVIPAGESRRLANSGGAGSSVGGASDDRPIVVQFVLDGQIIQQSLLRRKRQTGTELGIA